MSLWLIAWRSIRQRGLASLLTAASMALGVMLVVAVLSIMGVIQQSFRTNATLGYNMIIGARGGKLQLTLNTVYYLSTPIENVPYDYYLEFLPRAKRDAERAQSLQAAAQEERAALLELQSLVAAVGGGPALEEGASLSGANEPRSAAAGSDATVPAGASGKNSAVGLAEAVHRLALDAADRRQLDNQRDGRFSQFTKTVVPVGLGDYFGPFRVVATRPVMFDSLRYGERGDRPPDYGPVPVAGRQRHAHQLALVAEFSGSHQPEGGGSRRGAAGPVHRRQAVFGPSRGLGQKIAWHRGGPRGWSSGCRGSS